MNPATPPVFSVFVTASLLADAAGSPEISVEMLLSALDQKPIQHEVPEPITVAFVSIPHRELPLSKEAAAAVSSLGDIHSITPDALRTALLCTRQGGV